jgi:hypothetical protein
MDIGNLNQIGGAAMRDACTAVRFRKDRFFHIMGQGWYVETREGTKGSFSSRQIAERYLDILKGTLPEKRVVIW